MRKGTQGIRVLTHIMPNHPSRGAERGSRAMRDVHDVEESFRLQSLSMSFSDSYYATALRDDLVDAINTGKRSLAILPQGHIDQAPYLNNQALLLHAMYKEDGSLDDLQEAIELAYEATRVVPNGLSDLSRSLNNLTLMLSDRYEYTQEIDDLMESVEVAQLALDTSPEGHPNRAEFLNSLGIVMNERFRQTGDEDDLRRTLEVTEEACRITPKDDYTLSACLGNWASALRDEHYFTGRLARPDKAIEVARQAVEASSNEHPDKSEYLYVLGVLLFDRYDMIKERSDLEEAIVVFKEALSLKPEDEPDQNMLWIQLGDALNRRYAMTSSLSDLDEAIDYGRRTAELAPEDHEDRPVLFGDYIARLGKRYQRTGSIADWDEAIEAGLYALNTTPEDHPSRGQLLHNIGNRFFDRFDSSGDMAYLDKVIHYTRRAIDLIPDDSIDWVMAASSFSVGLDARYTRTSALSDLDDAIRISEEVVDKTQDTDLERTQYFHNLGLSLQERYDRMGELADLEKAINLATLAVEKSTDGDPNREHYLGGYSSALHSRFQRAQSLDDLERSIEVRRRALSLTPEGHPDHSAHVHSLAASLREKYYETDSMRDLNEAVDLARKALDTLENNHAHRAQTSNLLGVTLLERSRVSRNEEDVRQAIDCLSTAMSQTQASISSRISAGRALIIQFINDSNWEKAFEVSKDVVDLIPRLVLRSIENSDKQDVLRQVNGLASDGAALALQMGEAPAVALDMLERGRGVMATSLEDIGLDITDLNTRHPELAAQFLSLREEMRERTGAITINGPRKLDTSWALDRNRRRYEANDEFEELVAEIRRKPGFANFMLPPSEAEVMQAAKSGPIVIVNSGQFRSDAIIIEQHQITSVPLPEYSREKLAEYLKVDMLKTPEALEWLWDSIAEPVLDSLGFSQPPTSNKWPRLWWITPGLLNKLPIHAAGYHRQHSCRTVLDRVISSYHTSVRAIIRSRQNVAATPMRPGRALMLAMGHTPGSSSLPFAPREVDAIQRPFKSMTLDPIELQPNKQDILAHLPHCSIFHFAGHGFANTNNPLESYLALSRGKQDSLTIANLLKINLYKSPPFLAYLSACGTGQVRDVAFSDESIHLINGFLLAGFRHVIGTLWEVQDEVCVDIARLTYEVIAESGMSDYFVAWGLHQATTALRDRWLKSLNPAKVGSSEDVRGERDIMSFEDDDPDCLHWIPYIHFGV